MSDCIEWTGPKDQDGYGRANIEKKPVRIHRWIWEKHYGTIPKDMVIRHKCNNPSCYNIEHLDIGTHKDNMQDMVKTGRSAKGIKNGGNKLTEEQVLEIKNLKNNNKKGDVKRLADKFNIHRTTIYHIWNNRMWSKE